MLDLSPRACAGLKGEVYGIDASAASVLSGDKLHGAVARSQRGRSAGSHFQVIRDAGDEFEDCPVGREERPGLGWSGRGKCHWRRRCSLRRDARKRRQKDHAVDESRETAGRVIYAGYMTRYMG